LVVFSVSCKENLLVGHADVVGARRSKKMGDYAMSFGSSITHDLWHHRDMKNRTC
jgi:hypothetical protein